MIEPRELQFYLDNGCYHAALGKAKVPPGYAVLIQEDDGYSFWIGPDGEEGVRDWNKWRSLKRAKLHHAENSQPSLL